MVKAYKGEDVITESFEHVDVKPEATKAKAKLELTADVDHVAVSFQIFVIFMSLVCMNGLLKGIYDKEFWPWALFCLCRSSIQFNVSGVYCMSCILLKLDIVRCVTKGIQPTQYLPKVEYIENVCIYLSKAFVPFSIDDVGVLPNAETQAEGGAFDYDG